MKVLMIKYLKENVDKEAFLEPNHPVLAIVQVLVMDSKEETHIMDKKIINIISMNQEFILQKKVEQIMVKVK